ncbi:MAG: hypothetical protein J5698_04265 [Bacteroidaceae bacterium]|nr:hypothetical protein [Bacteroidaceae bacterium]
MDIGTTIDKYMPLPEEFFLPLDYFIEKKHFPAFGKILPQKTKIFGEPMEQREENEACISYPEA